MNVIEIKGPIISNNEAWIYDWLEIEHTCPKNVNSQLTGLDGQDVTVEINSPGGSVFAGSEIYTSLKSYPGNVVVKIVGLAASAASVIAMAGNTVQISPTAQMMIHNSSIWAEGDKNYMNHTVDFLKGIDESISSAYKLKSGLTAEELLELMDNETWMTAKTALELGLVDEIMFESEIPEIVATDIMGGMLPRHVVNKLRSTLKQEDSKDSEKEKELNNKLKELDLKLTLKGL